MGFVVFESFRILLTMAALRKEQVIIFDIDLFYRLYDVRLNLWEISVC